MGSAHSSSVQNNANLDSSALDLSGEVPDLRPPVVARDRPTVIPPLSVSWSSVDDGRTLEMQNITLDLIHQQFQETLDLIHQLGGNTVPTEADSNLSHPSSPGEPQNENGGEVEDIGLEDDDVPYEVILALEEIVGTSRSRLTEESISAGVEQRKHQPIELGSSAEDIVCCICLESYADGDVLGKIKCGHDYHYSCIEKWLLRKNKCPLCKRTAVPESASST